MDPNLQRTSSWWIIVLISVSTLSESRLVHSRGPGPSAHSRTNGNISPKASAVEQQHNAGFGARPRPVAVTCHPDSMEVVVQADMFDTGLRVEGTHLRLGSESVTGETACWAMESGQDEFTIRAHLADCGTKLSSTNEKIIYSNVLVYSPEASSDGLLRLDRATIPIECHYGKKYAVDSISLQPTWVPFVSRISSEDKIDFILRLMTDDWQFERGSYSYFLGDPIHFEVSAIIGNHMPLQVYVDHCVATATPDAEATVRYDFIERHGCLTEAYLTNSSSHFLQREMKHKLRFQIDAFRFYQEPSNQVYITCNVKAVPVTLAVSSQQRACSFTENRWKSIDGNDEVCGSCDVSHPVEAPQPTEPPTTTVSTEAWSNMITQESLLQSSPDQHPATYIRFRPAMHRSQHNKPHQSSARVMRGADNKAEKTVQLGPIFALPSRKYVTKPTVSKIMLSPIT